MWIKLGFILVSQSSNKPHTLVCGITQELCDLNMAKTLSKNEKFAEIVKGYTEFANGGHREIFLIE